MAMYGNPKGVRPVGWDPLEEDDGVRQTLGAVALVERQGGVRDVG